MSNASLLLIKKLQKMSVWFSQDHQSCFSPRATPANDSWILFVSRPPMPLVAKVEGANQSGTLYLVCNLVPLSCGGKDESDVEVGQIVPCFFSIENEHYVVTSR